MSTTAKLFMNGRSQAVRLPAEFRFDGKEVMIRRNAETGEVILSAISEKAKSWEEFFHLRGQTHASDRKEFLKDREQGEDQRGDLFDDL
jgi:antitoxin VapB